MWIPPDRRLLRWRFGFQAAPELRNHGLARGPWSERPISRPLGEMAFVSEVLPGEFQQPGGIEIRADANGGRRHAVADRDRKRFTHHLGADPLEESPHSRLIVETH
jgi:hypothetical protein